MEFRHNNRSDIAFDLVAKYLANSISVLPRFPESFPNRFDELKIRFLYECPSTA
jgi:hypothetical protein